MKVGVLVLIAMGLASCGKPSSPVIAVVEGSPVTQAHFEDARMGAEGLEDREIFGRLLMRTALVARAKSRGWTASREDVEAKLRAWDVGRSNHRGTAWRGSAEEEVLMDRVMKEEVLPYVRMGESDIQAASREYQRDWKRKSLVLIAQIVTAERQAAEAAEAAVKRDPAQFGLIAQRSSIAPEAARRGELEEMGEDELPPFLAAVVSTLKAGQISPILRTPYGYHLVWVKGRRVQPERTWEDIRPLVVRRLQRERREEALGRWFRETVKCSVSPKFATLLGWINPPSIPASSSTP